ncbi:hypothetical protein SCCGRSA3_02034 [Marine Group I thaumarchaeote SCGC RSA3]|uniref:Uncharacterized protein n=2 Tax=Marine Group I TaxID=905826 RepID=A0A081RMX2_9ARCH|nr:hypothetical protein AAA799N04_01037 [Marine Group I thaumarchaeote SCGC AAA799-N04]KFM16831.1 hypothetical protein SCCGRSA3_02034 [Marine Group I thaumarchaeote SCGC RSA3]
MIENYFRNYISKLKDTKKIARQKNIAVWYMPLIDSLLITYFVSWMISYHSWIFMGNFQELSNSSIHMKWFWEFSVYFPFVFWGILLVSVLPKLVHVMILIHHYIMKLVFVGINKFDLWYWRKYKKESVLANAIWKSQSQIMGMDKQRKRQIFVIFLAVVVAYYFVRLELL